MKTLVAMDETLLAVILRALAKYETDARRMEIRDAGLVQEIPLVMEAARQVQVALDLLAQARAAAPK